MAAAAAGSTFGMAAAVGVESGPNAFAFLDTGSGISVDTFAAGASFTHFLGLGNNGELEDDDCAGGGIGMFILASTLASAD